ncbi:MAG: magnesium transporter CorA family protein, partial [Lachnospiraceae bacterium]|nr:magnesium transporter CorA family protein [Lachnospiraceae bacterium]
FLASITLVMSIPNIISGLYGMNVNSDGVPLAESVYGFGSICGIIFAICLIAILILRKKDLL